MLCIFECMALECIMLLLFMWLCIELCMALLCIIECGCGDGVAMAAAKRMASRFTGHLLKKAFRL